MTDKKCLGKVRAVLEGEVYSRRFGMEDVLMVVRLVNDMFHNEVNIKVLSIKEEKE